MCFAQNIVRFCSVVLTVTLLTTLALLLSHNPNHMLTLVLSLTKTHIFTMENAELGSFSLSLHMGISVRSLRLSPLFRVPKRWLARLLKSQKPISQDIRSSNIVTV